MNPAHLVDSLATPTVLLSWLASKDPDECLGHAGGFYDCPLALAFFEMAEGALRPGDACVGPDSIWIRYNHETHKIPTPPFLGRAIRIFDGLGPHIRAGRAATDLQAEVLT